MVYLGPHPLSLYWQVHNCAMFVPKTIDGEYVENLETDNEEDSYVDTWDDIWDDSWEESSEEDRDDWEDDSEDLERSDSESELCNEPYFWYE